jgi:hypothetical protein
MKRIDSETIDVKGINTGNRTHAVDDAQVFRLAFAALAEGYGIPAHTYFDNGPSFAAKSWSRS